MIIKVINRENPEIECTYTDVVDVENVYSSTGVYCHRLVINNAYGEPKLSSTFSASEWSFYKLEFVKMF